MRKGGLDGLPDLKYTNIQSLSNKKSVTVSPVFTVHTLKKGEIKKVSVLKRLPRFLTSGPLVCIGKMVEIGKIFLV